MPRVAASVPASIISLCAEGVPQPVDSGDVTGGVAPAMLFDEHDQFVAVWEHAADAMALSDAAGRVIAANPAYYELYGYRPDEILGQSFAIIFPPAERVQAEAQYHAVFTGADQAPAFEATVRRADGTTRIVEARYAFTMHAGRRTAMLSIIRDITERKRIEAELRERTEMLEIVNRVGRKLGAELDLQQLVQAVTDAATGLTGARFGAFFYNLTDERGESYTLYALSGVPRQAFAGIPLPRNTALFGLTFRGERVIRLDDVRQDARYGRNPPYAGLPAGHPPVVSYLAVPVISRSGEVIGGLFFGHEQAGVFTEQAEWLVVGLAAQAAVAVDNARLFQAAQQEIKARAGFLTTASHELRTPVATIKAYTQLLGRVAGRERLEQSRIVHLASQLEAQVGRLERLVNDLLDVTRIQHGRMDLRREWVDLSAVAAQVLARFEHARERTPEHLLVLEADEPVLAFLDRGRIDQVLTNLVSNALKYSPDGGKVCVSVRAAGGEVEVAVQDHGLGIPADEQGALFQPFGRSESVRLSINGVGLGLYLTRQIVEQHGGTIDMHSVSGRGSIFTVRLPVGGETE